VSSVNDVMVTATQNIIKTQITRTFVTFYTLN